MIICYIFPQVRHSLISHNKKAGFLYDPFFTEYDALIIRNMIYPERKIFMFDESRRVVVDQKDVYKITINSQNQDQYFLLSQAGQANISNDYYVEVRANYRMTIQVD